MGNKNKRNLQKPSNPDKPKKAKTIELVLKGDSFHYLLGNLYELLYYLVNKQTNCCSNQTNNADNQ